MRCHTSGVFCVLLLLSCTSDRDAADPSGETDGVPQALLPAGHGSGASSWDPAHPSPDCRGRHCSGPDLVVELDDAQAAVEFRREDVEDSSCQLNEGCLLGSGHRSLMELNFTVRNAGNAPLELGAPFESDRFHASLCQDSYVLYGFFIAELRDAQDHVVAQGELTTSCLAGDGGRYRCTAQGLDVGEMTEQPAGSCDFLDVTGLAKGDYALRVTVNPARAVAESNYDNNSAELSVYYPDCDGTVCAGACCAPGVQCIDDVCALPDLRVNREAAAASLWLSHQTFGAESCELEEQCVSGSGRRRLLSFEGRIENVGQGDLNPGPEEDNPLFEYSSCHDHYHFRDFTQYRLLNADGSSAAEGHKQSFCLISMEPVDDNALPSPPGTRPEPGDMGCNYLAAGWADIYGLGTPCQWIDVTDVAEGDYVVELSVNPLGRVAEVTTDNNTVLMPIHIPADGACVPQPEVCGDAIDQDCDEEPDVWDIDCAVECYPGQPGCDPNCYPGNPDCREAIPVAGNDTCATAAELIEAGVYEAAIAASDAGEATPSCGGEGGDAFFRFTLDARQAVYLATLGSEFDTVLSVHRDDCGGAELDCEDTSCGGANAQVVDVLEPGSYLVVVKAKRPGSSGLARLTYQHADAGDATVVSHPGIYPGDTTSATDTINACDLGGPPTGPDNVYVLATCSADLVASTCGASTFQNRISVRPQSLENPDYAMCSEDGSQCRGDRDGGAVYAYGPRGLTFVVVEGRTASDIGEYQLSLIY